MLDRSQSSWFALRVKSRHEKLTSSVLESKGYEQFLPLYRTKRKWTDRIKQVDLPLFPGYVFCRFNPTTRSSVLNTPGVVDIVGFGRELAIVEESEIDALKRVVSSQLSCEPCAPVAVGGTVRIEDGPLEGLTGRVVEVKKSLRLVLSVTLLQRSVLVEIDRAWVAPETNSDAGEQMNGVREELGC
ncbi:MAG: UpxY family transcription antiterminator [Bryobacteraceae bacterium]